MQLERRFIVEQRTDNEAAGCSRAREQRAAATVLIQFRLIWEKTRDARLSDEIWDRIFGSLSLPSD